MKHFLPILFCINLISLSASGKSDQQDILLLFTAASTVDVVAELAESYASRTDLKILLNHASSGILAKQLKEGAQAELYISASKKWMDYVSAEDLVLESRSFAANRMVLIAPAHSPAGELKSMNDFPSSFTGHLSMGDPGHVPAGVYARQILEYYSCQEALKDRILPGINVRAALSVVELEEAERGIVYKTDALKSDKVKILWVFPRESHQPVAYYCGLLKQASPEGRAFFDFINTDPEASEILSRYGFDRIAGEGD